MFRRKILAYIKLFFHCTKIQCRSFGVHETILFTTHKIINKGEYQMIADVSLFDLFTDPSF